MDHFDIAKEILQDATRVALADSGLPPAGAASARGAESNTVSQPPASERRSKSSEWTRTNIALDYLIKGQTFHYPPSMRATVAILLTTGYAAGMQRACELIGGKK